MELNRSILLHSCVAITNHLKPMEKRTPENISEAILQLQKLKSNTVVEHEKDFCDAFIYVMRYLQSNKEPFHRWVPKFMRAWFKDEFGLN